MSDAESGWGPRLLGVGAACAWAYGCLVFLGGLRALIAFAAGSAVMIAAPRLNAVRRRLSAERMLELGLALIASVSAVVAADIAATVVRNRRQARADATISAAVRLSDPRVWHGELVPRSYYPTDRNFTLYKPDVRLAAMTYGEYYTPDMLASRLLLDSVLELRYRSYAIGPLGLRDTTPVSASRIFALGDSFVLGYATAEGKVWTDLLGAALREPVYNLGVSATGPRAHVQLLEYLLATHGDSLRPRQVLWMIFEGNDLENSYLELRPDEPAARRGPLDGTVLEAIGLLPSRLRQSSVLRRLIIGQDRAQAPPAFGRYQQDGVRLSVPLFHSARWGYRLFSPYDLERATMPAAYVRDHPNRPRLDQAMRDMRDLARRHGFAVTVVFAPSDARMYGKDFEEFPPLSERPWFAEYVAAQADSLGFGMVNLVPLLAPFAASEMLYYRDDHHWNERGNAVVAQLIAAALDSTQRGREGR